MLLGRMEAPDYSAPETIMRELRDTRGGAFVGHPGVFYLQLSKRLGIDTRRLASAVDRLHDAGKLVKLKSGNRYFYVVGIALPGRSFNRGDISHLDDWMTV